ncbi:MAG: histidinol-phosphate transaminase [Bacteroidota bacterium]
MTSKHISRRDWLKKGALATGAAVATPYLGFSEQSKMPLTLNSRGEALYSPFFKEYLLKDKIEFPVWDAKLNANENPYGPSPKALEAFKNAAAGGNRYAWKELIELMEKIAEFEGVAFENIMMGPGSSDLLEKTAMVLCMKGGNVLSADPAYMSLIQVAKSVGASWKPVPLKKDWSHDLEGMEAAVDAETKLVYICNPNNPTATITDHDELLDFCSRVSEKVPVFVDEAYLAFLGEGLKRSMVGLINEGKDIIIARTFSKIHGMAGLRVGYIVGQESTLGKLREITRGGMGISYPSVLAASAAMDDTEFLDKSRILNQQSREYVYERLSQMNIDYVPSHTSFIIFPIDLGGQEFLEKMTDLKVGVRAFQFMDQDWCRVSMGTMDEMKLFADALTKVLV